MVCECFAHDADPKPEEDPSHPAPGDLRLKLRRNVAAESASIDCGGSAPAPLVINTGLPDEYRYVDIYSPDFDVGAVEPPSVRHTIRMKRRLFRARQAKEKRAELRKQLDEMKRELEEDDDDEEEEENED